MWHAVLKFSGKNIHSGSRQLWWSINDWSPSHWTDSLIQAYISRLLQISVPELKGHSNVKTHFCSSKLKLKFMWWQEKLRKHTCALYSLSHGTVSNGVNHRTWLKNNYLRLTRMWKPSVGDRDPSVSYSMSSPCAGTRVCPSPHQLHMLGPETRSYFLHLMFQPIF